MLMKSGGSFGGLQLLAEAAVAVSVCQELHGGCCGHSDPASCFFTTKKRKLSSPQTHHSLLAQTPTNKSPSIKLVIKLKQPAAKVSDFPTALEVAPISFVLTPTPPPPAPPIPPPHSSVSANYPHSKVKLAPLVPNSRREEFPSSFRARVSSTFGRKFSCLGEQVFSGDSEDTDGHRSMQRDG
ncbi:unnamed protein product [Linum trigynum]|uniref:Uncharacterized protein n=1 Tax=Linum trigynum TaxID=586398 RepID=A0AAV2C799_9ROSI